MLLDLIFIVGVAYGSFWLGGKYKTLGDLLNAVLKKLGVSHA